MIIYKTTNLINGKIYIGKDNHNNPDYLGSGLILRKAIEKYGRENFKKEILEACSSISELNDREIFWITTFDSTKRGIGYNIAMGGTGGDTYSGQSDDKKTEIKHRHRELMTQRFSTVEGRKRQSEALKRRWANPLARKRMSDSMKNRKITWSDKISNSLKERYKIHPMIISMATRKKHSERTKGVDLKIIPIELEKSIIELYQIIGPKLISDYFNDRGIDLSPYLIRRVLKKNGIYRKYQKGIGALENKKSSIDRRGEKNPRWVDRNRS